MEKEKKLAIIKKKSQEALNHLADAMSCLKEAEQETEYEFSVYLTQDIADGYPDNAYSKLEELANGDRDSDLLEYELEN